jgi:uncharacterized protein HemY
VFVLRSVMWCLSLPFFWLGQLAGMGKMPLCVPLLKVAWYLGGDGNVAVWALSRIQQYVSSEAALLQAAAWLTRRPQAAVAAKAGLLAIQAGQIEEAKNFLVRAQQIGPDPTGLLELLEILVAGAAGSAAGVADLVRRLEARRDLSPIVSKYIHEHLLCEALFAGRFEEAERRARWSWSIEDNPLAATTFWVLARRRGSRDGFERYCGRLHLAAPQALYFQTLGHIACGETDAARSKLAMLDKADPSLAGIARFYLDTREPTA